MKISDLENAIAQNKQFGLGDGLAGRLVTASKKDENITERADDNGNKHCWTGYRKVGLKKKGGKMVNDCRPIKKK
jgi:hypothetical protein